MAESTTGAGRGPASGAGGTAGPGRAASGESATGETELGFDKVLGRLRGVVERLETGELSLEESLKVFEEGIRLSRRGAEILDAAERRVEILLKGGPRGDGEGSERVAPFQEVSETLKATDERSNRDDGPR